MNDVSLYGLDAMWHGALVALLAVLPATALFWLPLRGLAAGPRWLRPVVAGWASLGLTAMPGLLYATVFERDAFEGEAMGGILLAGFVLQLLVCLVLLILPRGT